MVAFTHRSATSAVWMAKDGMGVIRGVRDAAMAMANVTPGKTRVNEGEEEIGAHHILGTQQFWPSLHSEGYF